MNKRMLDCALASYGSSTPTPALNLLLVARDRDWSAAVSDAVSDIGPAGVSSCDARGALLRLSATRKRYSHLLVQPESADGLIEMLADVTSKPAGSQTSMLILGRSDTTIPGTDVIASADGPAIRSALTAAARPKRAATSALLPDALRAALSGGMIETRYQPIVSMADGSLLAVEALARLNHPSLGTLSADRFIPQMEAAGLAAQLTDVVCRATFTDLAGGYLRDLGLCVTINFPLDVLLSPSALDLLETQRAAAGIEAGRVVVELTESQPVEDFARLRASVVWLRARGYKVAIDDAGPAVPALTPLLDLPFTTVKLDMSLVRQVNESAVVKEFVAATVERAHHQGMKVVAEGVETVPLWRAMKELGVDAVQGFLVARPLPAAAVPVWLAAWNDTPEFC